MFNLKFLEWSKTFGDLQIFITFHQKNPNSKLKQQVSSGTAHLHSTPITHPATLFLPLRLPSAVSTSSKRSRNSSAATATTLNPDGVAGTIKRSAKKAGNARLASKPSSKKRRGGSKPGTAAFRTIVLGGGGEEEEGSAASVLGDQVLAAPSVGAVSAVVGGSATPSVGAVSAVVGGSATATAGAVLPTRDVVPAVAPVPVVSGFSLGDDLEGLLGEFGEDLGDEGESLPPNIATARVHLNARRDRENGIRVNVCTTDTGRKASQFTLKEMSLAGSEWQSPGARNEYQNFDQLKCATGNAGLARVLNMTQVGMCYRAYEMEINSLGQSCDNLQFKKWFKDECKKMMEGTSILVKPGKRGITIMEAGPDGTTLVPMSAEASIGPSWLFDLELSFFFWTYDGGVGVSATLHRIIVRTKPVGETNANTANSFLSNYA